MAISEKSIGLGAAQLLVNFYDKHDEEALTEFFIRFKDITFKIAYSIVGNQADADDIMQQSFIQIIKKQSICKEAYHLDDAKVKSWVLSIVYNFARMHLRSQKTKREYLQKEERKVMMDVNSKTTEDSSLSDITETKVKLKTAIFELPEKYRVPILMRYHEDMSIEEISKTLSSNPNTIRSILSRGINLLRNKLSPENIMLSSTAAIEMIATVPYPISQKTISLGFVKSCAATKTISAKVAVSTISKASLLLKSIIVSISVVVLGGGLLYFHFQQAENQELKLESNPNVIANTLKFPQIYDASNWKDLKLILNKGSLEIKDGNIITKLNEKNWVQFLGVPKTPYVIKFDLIGYANKGSSITTTISGFFSQKESTENFGDLNFYLNGTNKIVPDKGSIFPYRNGNAVRFKREFLFIKNEIYQIQNDKFISKQKVEDNDGQKLEYGVSLINLDISRIEIDQANKNLVEEAINGDYILQNSNLKKGENFKDITSEK